MKIILGSQSKSRQNLLKRMGYEFEVMNPDIDEKAIRFDDPKKLTLALAHAKADALLPKIHEPAILITADQVVFCGGKIREKPASEKEAREALRGYKTHPLETVTAVVVTNTSTSERNDGVDVAKVWLRPIPASIIEALIKEGDVFSRAGGFSIENPLLKNYVEKTEGELESILGLPKEFAWRKKSAAQYGSKFDFALEKLAKAKGLTKSEYLLSV